MIVFKKITVKNFLSYGNVPTVIELSKHNATLVTGPNGQGKSVLIDSISFVLYNKPFRKINLGQLINSINGRDTSVIIEFSVGADDYRVYRGLKPNKMEIYKNDELINQEAAVRDYQGYLEKNILKISHRTFTQVFILGAATFTPFMQLPAGQRREIVEDVLDIGVFTQMNKLLRERVSVLKDEMRTIDLRIDHAKAETNTQRSLIGFMDGSKQSRIDEINSEIDELKIRLHQTNESYTANKETIQRNNNVKPDAIDPVTVSEQMSDKKRSIRDINTKRERIAHLNNCPTCMQAVGDEHKSVVGDELAYQLTELETSLNELETVYLKQKADWVKLNEWLEVDRKLGMRDVVLTGEIERFELAIQSLDAKLLKVNTGTTSDIDAERDKLRALARGVVEVISRRNEIIKERAVQDVCLNILKDTGIKSKIVKEYLPVLNRLINKYLTEFEFFVNFELDENFSETIKSRGRDDFSYMSFSEGEKKRIDVAILLAFRQIASMKNSAKINLLISDEVDGGLDGAALDKFVDLVTTGIDANSWVISHVLTGTELVNKFDAVMHVAKEGDFSVMTLEE